MRVGLFDSGVGGLTVLRTLEKAYPNNEYIYYGDTKNAPYGNKGIDELTLLASNIIEFLLSFNVDLIVIACGTVSSNITSILKAKYNTKIVDIISPTIKYINNSNYSKIGVLATTATIKSEAFKRINKNVKEIECPKLVPLIENNNFNGINKYINKYLYDLKDRDLIILGCTHYPIIKQEIIKYISNTTKLLDMSECLLEELTDGKIRKIELYFSKLNKNVLNNINNIIGFKIDSINEI